MFKHDSHVRAIPQRASSEETRRLVLDTALTLFREHGFDKTTLRDIAGRAGLSPGAAYYYFKSKEALVAAYYEFVQREHQARVREVFARDADLRSRLGAAFHTKIDIVQDDRRLLRALFRFGGDPGHPLSWFGTASREQRRLSIAIFAEAIEKERFPDDVREASPTLLWTLHMGILLYFLYDDSPNERRTRRLIDAAVGFTVEVKRLATSALLRPLRRKALSIIREAGLLAQ
jgi:AcrR family transcriptional regulator